MARTVGILILLLYAAQAISEPEQPPEFVFTIQTEKQVFKPGEPVWVEAILRNQSSADVYVPHAMTSCSGLESQVRFSLLVVRGKPTLHGRGCGMGGGCGDCGPPPSFEQHVRTSWILLHPGEIFGARIDSSVDAPEAPGIYKLQAEYVPENLVTGDRSGPEGNQIRVIAKTYKAAPIEIMVGR
jgi:hypothetical protein